MTRLQVTFRCSLPVDVSAHPPGEELAEYLSRRFTDGGLPITAVDNYEDFAWSLDTTHNGKKLFLLLGYVGDGDYEWLLQINDYVSSFWQLFRWNHALAERREIAQMVDQILQSDESISVIRWHAGDFAEEDYTSSP